MESISSRNLPLVLHTLSQIELAIDRLQERTKNIRSVDDFPCNQMAEEFFNGGGHLNASGGRLNCSMEEAIEIVRKAIIAYENKLK